MHACGAGQQADPPALCVHRRPALRVCLRRLKDSKGVQIISLTYTTSTRTRPPIRFIHTAGRGLNPSSIHSHTQDAAPDDTAAAAAAGAAAAHPPRWLLSCSNRGLLQHQTHAGSPGPHHGRARRLSPTLPRPGALLHAHRIVRPLRGGISIGGSGGCVRSPIITIHMTPTPPPHTTGRQHHRLRHPPGHALRLPPRPQRQHLQQLDPRKRLLGIRGPRL